MIDKIIELEWEFFDKVKNLEGRASCQNDFESFQIYRKAQYDIFDEILLESYYMDLKRYEEVGSNPITLKYAYMMESSDKEYFDTIKDQLPEVDEKKLQIIEQIIAIELGMREEFNEKYPNLSRGARTIYSKDDTKYDTSFETYLRGELKTYSNETLRLYGEMIVRLMREGKNFVELVQERTVKYFGYDGLDEAEK